jgi:integrase
MPCRLTVSAIKKLAPGQTLWDSQVPGFGCRCQRKRRIYVLKTRINGRQRWLSIGTHGAPWTVETARQEARRLLGEIAGGHDPAAERSFTKRLPDIAVLSQMFLDEHVTPKCKPATARHYRALLERLILGGLGHLRVDQIGEADVARFHNSLRDTPFQANRALAVLSRMLSFAESRGFRPNHSNPCRGIKKYHEPPKQRFLTDEEVVRLGEALVWFGKQGGNPFVAAALRLLLLTGARLNEVLSLKWSDVDLERQTIFLPDSKTGARPLYLSSAAASLLHDLPRQSGKPHVFPGDGRTGHLVNLQKPWSKIRARAGLSDVRLHDLRHSYASKAASSGASLLMIGKLLGHTQAQTTQRYAHLVDNPLKELNAQIGAAFDQAFGVTVANLPPTS